MLIPVVGVAIAATTLVCALAVRKAAKRDKKVVARFRKATRK